ncbi:MAG: tetratricopeptide repeat protein [Bacteroidales bacterium]
MKRLVIGLVIMIGFVLQGVAQVEIMPDTTKRVQVQHEYFFAKGLEAKMLGNNDQAISFFQKCIEVSQVSGSAFYELGLLYSEKKDYAAATGYARNAWKRDPANKWYGLLLIQSLLQEGKQIDCVPVYRDLQKIEPGNEDFLSGEIEMLIQSKQQKEALKRINKLPGDGELDRWGAVRRKDVYLSMNQFDKGTKSLLEWLKKNPGDYEIRGILAEAYATKGLKTLAEEQYKILKTQNPDNPAVSFSLGQFYYQTGRKEEALDEFLQGFRSPDVNPAIKIEIVKSFISAQDQKAKLDPQVVKLIELIYQVDKGDPQVDELYANYLYSEERLGEAELIYRTLIKSDPGNFVVWQNLLFILNQKQDFKEIVLISDSALVYFPAQGLFYLFKGMAAIDQKDYPMAVSTLNKGLSVPGQNPDLVKQFYLSLAEALYRNGNADEAFRNYDQMLVLEPDNVLVLNNYSYYLSLEGRELDKALDMIGRCIKIEPENPTYLDTFAWVLYQRKEYGKALNPMVKAIKFSSDPSGEVLEHYGDILFRLGRIEEAKQQWTQAKGKKDVSTKIDEKIKNGLQ